MLDFGGHRFRRVHPFAMFPDEIGEAADGFRFRNIEFHGGLADVEVDLVRGTADVAEIGVRHFAGTVDDATHDGNSNALEMAGGGADFLCGVLEIEQGAAAAWAGDVVGLEDAGAGGLQDVVGEPQRLAGCRFATDEDRIADAVTQQRADVLRGGKQRLEEIRVTDRWVERVLEQDRMSRIDAEGELAEGVDDFEIEAVFDGDERG